MRFKSGSAFVEDFFQWLPLRGSESLALGPGPIQRADGFRAG